MANEAISEYSATASSNTDINGIGILGTNSVVNFDNAFRELMSQLADMNAGTSPLDDTFSIMDPVDNTKVARFDCDGITTATTRVYTLPDSNGTLALLGVAQTWSATNTFTGTAVFSDLRLADGEVLNFTNAADNDYISFNDTTNVYSFFADASQSGCGISVGFIRLLNATDVSLSSTDHAFQIGDSSSVNMAVDANEIQVRNNGAAQSLNLNPEGGVVNVGSGGVSNQGDETTFGRAGLGAVAKTDNFLYIEGNFVGAANGMVYINDTRDSSPSTDVAIRFGRLGSTVGLISTTGSATTYATSSDERLKRFKGEYTPEEAIAVIKADPVRVWDWIEQMGGGTAIGWGAQTSYRISPDLATPGDDDPEKSISDPGFQAWGVDQGKRTPYLWAALAGVIARLEAVEAELEALRGAA